MLDIILGVLIIILGVCVIYYYENYIEKVGLSFKLGTVGLCLIVVGVGLILHELNLI